MVIKSGDLPRRDNVFVMLHDGEKVLTAKQTAEMKELLDEFDKETGSGPESEDDA